MKYQRFTPSGGKNIGIGKSEFVTKTQFLNTRKDIFLIIMKQKGLTGSRLTFHSITGNAKIFQTVALNFCFFDVLKLKCSNDWLFFSFSIMTYI